MTKLKHYLILSLIFIGETMPTLTGGITSRLIYRLWGLKIGRDNKEIIKYWNFANKVKNKWNNK